MSAQSTYRQLASQHSLPLFFQPCWLDAVMAKWGAAIAYEGQTPVAVMPYNLEQKLGVRIMRNPLLTPYQGPYFLPACTNQNAALENLWHALPRWDFCSIQCLPGLELNSFLTAKGLICQPHVTHIASLHAEEETLYRNIKEKRRARIRKAAAELTITENEQQHTDVFAALHRDMFTRKKLPYPYPESFLKNLMEHSRQQHAGSLLTVAGQNIQAGIFVAYDSHTMYLLLSAFNPETAHPGAVSLLIWEAMKLAKALGLTYFDFEGSMDPGIAEFFRSFGGQQANYLHCTANKSLLWKWKQKLLG